MALHYQTSRLEVSELFSEIAPAELSPLLVRVTELLTPAVVENLPPHFQHIDSLSDARKWFKRMVVESRLFVVKHTEANVIIGFMFVFIGSKRDAHIGYLLGEPYWGQGLATELLQGFIDISIQGQSWDYLIAGVSQSNKASAKLLLRLGFVEQPCVNGPVVFFRYLLSQPRL
ncbi:GNAT family N-acetyltransferase [Shewanella sp. 0m-4]